MRSQEAITDANFAISIIDRQIFNLETHCTCDESRDMVMHIIAAAVAEANAELDHQIRKGFDAIIDTKHDCTEWQSIAAKWEERCLYAEKVLNDHEITISVPTIKSAMACSTIAPVRCVRQSASATAPETAQNGEALEPVTEINALLKENSELREVCDVQRETISKIQEQFGQEGRRFHLHHLVSVLKKERDDLKKERDRLRAVCKEHNSHKSP